MNYKLLWWHARQFCNHSHVRGEFCWYLLSFFSFKCILALLMALNLPQSFSMISYFFLRSIDSFLGSRFFFACSMARISAAVIFRFNWRPDELDILSELWLFSALWLFDIVGDVGFAVSLLFMLIVEFSELLLEFFSPIEEVTSPTTLGNELLLLGDGSLPFVVEPLVWLKDGASTNRVVSLGMVFMRSTTCLCVSEPISVPLTCSENVSLCLH